MKRNIYLMTTMLAYSTILTAQEDPLTTELWESVPPKVTPADPGQPPSDAIVLFNGKDLSGFLSEDNTDPRQVLADGYMTVNVDAPSLKTKRAFGDVQLYVEWRTPIEDQDEGQDKGNSGIVFIGKYEVQVLDSYNN